MGRTTMLLVALSMAAMADHAAGVWKLNVAKSKLTTTPRSQVTTITQDGDARVLETVTIAADGKETRRKVVTIADGKEHPFDGAALDGVEKPDSYVARSDAKNFWAEYKKGGKVVRKVHTVYSDDGKTRTQHSQGVDAQGKAYRTVSVFERQ